MAALDTVVVSTALTTIHRALGATVEQLEWTVNAYNVSFAVLLITGAALGDRYGRRRMYAAGLALFALASAGLRAGSLDQLADRRPRAAGSGRRAAHAARADAAQRRLPARAEGCCDRHVQRDHRHRGGGGPLVGGAVVQGIDWEWIFWLNVPIGLIAAPLVLSRIEESFGGDSAHRPARPGARHGWRARHRLGAGARQRRGLGQRRGARLAGRRPGPRGGVRRLGDAGAGADAAARASSAHAPSPPATRRSSAHSGRCSPASSSTPSCSRS